MHDLGRTQMESFEYDFEAETGVFSEAETTALATELMSVHGDAELEQFLGKLIKGAGRALGAFIKSPTGKALGGILKGAAKQAIPVVGGGLGRLIGGEKGGQIGTDLGAVVSANINSDPEFEFETAKDFVRMAAEAVKQVAAAAPSADAASTAKAAVSAAAAKHLPALLQAAARTAEGKWVRRGNSIVLLGV